MVRSASFATATIAAVLAFGFVNPALSQGRVSLQDVEERCREGGGGGSEGCAGIVESYIEQFSVRAGVFQKSRAEARREVEDLARELRGEGIDTSGIDDGIEVADAGGSVDQPGSIDEPGAVDQPGDIDGTDDFGGFEANSVDNDGPDSAQ